MRGSLQRIEILLIALALLLAGSIVALLTIVRPVAPALIPQRVPTPVALSAPTAEPALAAGPAPTRSAAAPMTPPATPAIAATTPGGFANAITVPGVARTLWPLLLLATGCLGLPLVTLRARRRRMPYTRQSVGQLLAT